MRPTRADNGKPRYKVGELAQVLFEGEWRDCVLGERKRRKGKETIWECFFEPMPQLPPISVQCGEASLRPHPDRILTTPAKRWRIRETKRVEREGGLLPRPPKEPA